VFDFLKRRRTIQPKRWVLPRLTFVGEQAGPAEDAFKSALRVRFATESRIRRAYLVRVAYPITGPQRSVLENRGSDGTAAPVEIALCLAATEDSGDDAEDARVAIVKFVGEEFAKLFASSQHMDTLFLSEDQEREVAAVARPFYRAHT